ncbi:MAG: hypothetical protein WCT54_01460 [Patescibacteria group bacterium]
MKLKEILLGLVFIFFAICFAGGWPVLAEIGHYIYVVLNFICMCFNWVVGIG